MDAIYFFKALHVVGFISWFAGLFYLGRMFVNHAEVDRRPENERAILWPEYIGMEWRVYRIITNPAMMLTWVAGLAMLMIDWTGIQTRAYFSTGTPGWLHLKLFLLVLLTLYHLYCKRLIRRMEAGERPFSPWQLRLWNEVPTLFLVSIPFAAVYGIGGRLNYGYLAVGLLLFAGMVYRGAVAYRKRRAAEEAAA